MREDLQAPAGYSRGYDRDLTDDEIEWALTRLPAQSRQPPEIERIEAHAMAELPYDVFLVYADSDRAWAEGYLRPALGVPPERLITRQGLRAGASIVAEFERAVTDSRYTILVLSPAFLADRWSEFGDQLAAFASVTERLDRVVPLVYRECNLPIRIDFRVKLDCSDPARWDQEIERLRGLLGRPEPESQRIECPYPGMVPFDEKDARFFYGREDEIRRMLRHFRDQRFLLVIGSSGSGKSSLIRAGLIPRLVTSTLFSRDFWLVRQMRPVDRPMHALAEALGGNPDPPGPLLAAHAPAQRLLLVVDQFEELFTQVEKAERSRFIAAMRALCASEGCAVLVAMRADFYTDLTNSDLWPVDPAQRLEIVGLRGEGLCQAIERPAADVGVYLEAGLAQRLVTDAADEPGALPLVQATMLLLWDRMRRRLIPLDEYERLGSDGRSGLAVAMASKADATLVELSEAGQKIARRIFLRLVQFGEGRADTRRQQPLAKLRSADDDPGEFDRTLEHLIGNRLLTPSGDDQVGGPVVDIAHEMLIIGWPRSQEWVKSRREAELMRRRLEAKAREWVERGRGVSGLLDEMELVEAERWLSSPDAADMGYDEALLALVHASRAAQREEAERQRRVERRTRRFLGTIAVLATTLLVIATWGYFRMRGYANEIMSRQLGTQAINCLHPFELPAGVKQPVWLDLALLLGAQAYDFKRDTFEARSALYTGMNYSPFLWKILPGHTAKLLALAFRTGGKALVSVGEDGKIIEWDILAIPAKGRILGNSGQDVSCAAFSPDGEILALAHHNSVQIWRTPGSGSRPEPLGDHESKVWYLAFSPDEKLLASAGSYGDIRLWDIATHRCLDMLHVEYKGVVSGLAFSPDGKMLTLLDSEGTVHLYDIGTSPPPARMPTNHHLGLTSSFCLTFRSDKNVIAVCGTTGSDPWQKVVFWDMVEHKHYVEDISFNSNSFTCIAFSHDGRHFAIGGPKNRGIRLGWGFATERVSIGHGEPTCLAFSPDGKILAAGETDGKIILCDVAARRPLTTQPGAGASVAFTPDGKILATAGSPIALWDVATRERIGELKTSIPQTVLAVSPDGSLLASTGIPPGPIAVDDSDAKANSAEWVIILWDLASRRALAQLPTGYRGPYNRRSGGGLLVPLTFSPPDGRLLASRGERDIILLWDSRTHKIVARLPAPSDISYAYDYSEQIQVAFSPDGKTLAIAYSHAIVLWDVSSREKLGAPPRRKQLVPWGPDKAAVTGLAFSPDGRTLAIGSMPGLVLWDIEAGARLPNATIGYSPFVMGLAFSPKGDIIALSTCYISIVLWDVAACQPLGPPLEQPPVGFGLVDSLAFSPDGHVLAMGCSKGYAEAESVYLLDVDPQSWQSRALRAANREITRDEWRQFVGPGEAYQPLRPGLPSPP